MKTCACGDPKNTGTPNKQNTIDAGECFFLVPTFADDGTRNEIKSDDTLDQAFFEAKVNNLDPSKRWYPIGSFTQVVDERATPNSESFNNGSSAIATQGVRTFNGWLLNYAPVYLEKIASLICNYPKLSIYTIDKCNELSGNYCEDIGGGVSALRPVAINTPSFDVTTYVKRQDAIVPKVPLMFEYEQQEQDMNLRKIVRESLGDADLKGLSGLIDMNGLFSAITTTSFNVAYTIDYDQVFTSKPVPGGVLANFNVFNRSTNTDLTPVAGVVESAEGVYDVTIAPAQASGNVLRVRTLIGKFFSDIDITIP